jgi:hypothetical protein
VYASKAARTAEQAGSAQALVGVLQRGGGFVDWRRTAGPVRGAAPAQRQQHFDASGGRAPLASGRRSGVR